MKLFPLFKTIATLDVETVYGDWCKNIVDAGNDNDAGDDSQLCVIIYYPFMFKSVNKPGRNYNRPLVNGAVDYTPGLHLHT